MAFFEFPHTRTYDSDLAWLIKAYKILTGKVDNIEQTIEDTINDALKGEVLNQLITQLIAESLLLNVKYPPAESGLTPAVGDGETDDTAALQAMIAYSSAHDMPLLFPAGTYRVSGLNVDVDTVFMGFASTLMLMNVSSAPLLNVSAKFACFGMTLNANIGGQTQPQNVISCTSGRFIIDHCHISSGLSGITGNVTGDCRLVNSEISNFSEYGLYLEGTGRIVSTGVDIPNIASGGALRFIRLDVSNSYIDAWESVAEISVGVEITGDNNYVSVNFPNVETPVNDGGQNNSWSVVGKSEKKYYNGNASISADNIQENAEGDISRQAADFTDNGTNYTSTMTGEHEIKADTVFINPTAPLKYGFPPSQQANGWFNTIPMQNADEKQYNVLVDNEKVDWLARGMVDIRLFGAVGDGTTNNNSAIQNALTFALAHNLTLFIPEGEFLITETLNAGKNIHIQGIGMNSVILHRPTTIYPLVRTDIDSENCTFRSFTLNSNASQESIWLQGEQHLVESVNFIYSGTGNALTVMGSGHRIINNLFYLNEHTSSWCIDLQSYAGDDGVHWSINCNITGNHLKFGYGGIKVTKNAGNQVEGLTIDCNTILGQGYGVSGSDLGFFGIQLNGSFVVSITNNIIDQIRQGIDINSEVFPNNRVNIERNYIGATSIAIQSTGTASYKTSNILIIGNDIMSNSANGVQSDINFNDARIVANSFSTSGPCLWIGGYNVVVTSNMCSTSDNHYVYLDGNNNKGGM